MKREMVGDVPGNVLGMFSDLAHKLQHGSLTPQELSLFLQRKNPFTGILIIDRSEPFNSVKFLGRGWSIEEEDERSLALTELDLSKVRLETMLKEGETCVKGEEKLCRLKATEHIRLDARIFQTFWENKHLIPENWKGKHIYFDGTVFRDPIGKRCVLYLCWGGDGWCWLYCWLEFGCWLYCWLEFDYPVNSHSAVLAE